MAAVKAVARDLIIATQRLRDINIQCRPAQLEAPTYERTCWNQHDRGHNDSSLSAEVSARDATSVSAPRQ